jgi:hypothetical protein
MIAESLTIPKIVVFLDSERGFGKDKFFVVAC